MHLRAKGPVSEIFVTRGNKFRLTIPLYKHIEGLIAARASGPAVTDVPPIADYTQWQPKSSGPLANIGLRIAKHKDSSQKGAERESHHLTQYLLVEYFYNIKKQKPFPAGITYPSQIQLGKRKTKSTKGVKLKSQTTVDVVENPAGGKPINLKEQNTGGRGKDMPAISLAVITHRSGNLHVPPGKPDDVADKHASSPGHAIHDEFLSRMPALKSKKTFKKYRDALTGNEANKNKNVHRDIFTAMQGTYAWMHKEMMGRLARNMPPLEADYYAELRERFKPENPLTDSERKRLKIKLHKVATIDAVKQNDLMMKDLGWSKPTK